MATVCFLTMVGRGVCYKAPPREQVWLQSHISSLGLPRLYGGLYTEWLCTENLQREREREMDGCTEWERHHVLVLASTNQRRETSHHPKQVSIILCKRRLILNWHIYEDLRGLLESNLCHRRQSTQWVRLSSTQMAAECLVVGQCEGGSEHSCWVRSLEDVTSQVSTGPRREENTQRRRRKRKRGKKGPK